MEKWELPQVGFEPTTLMYMYMSHPTVTVITLVVLINDLLIIDLVLIGIAHYL